MAQSTRTFPLDAQGWTPALFDELLTPLHPETRVRATRVVDSKLYGDGMVSTAGRLLFDLEYDANPDSLPSRMMVKIAKDEHTSPLYDNEVAFYTRLRPELDIETPRCFGGNFDPESRTFALLMEDLSVRGITFPNVTVPVAVDSIRDLLRTLARLHARTWNSPRLSGDLGWIQHHMRGELHHFFHDADKVPASTAYQVETEQHKREMVERLGLTVDQLYEGFRAVQAHQSGLAQCVLHGDTHIGNTYLLPDGSGGLLDWQLFSVGYCMHDVSYIIATGLSVGVRRQHERELLAFYLDALRSAGVADAPTFDEAWTEYRRAHVWNVYVGWLTTPVVNYGWQINVMAHLRVMTAFEDCETGKLLAQMR